MIRASAQDLACAIAITPKVDRDKAWRKLRTSIWNPAAYLIRAASVVGSEARGNGSLPRIEFVGMPHYLIKYEVLGRKTDGEVRCLIDGFTGGAQIVEDADALCEGPEPPPSEDFTPKLSAAEAEEAGRVALEKQIRRLARRAGGVELGSALVNAPARYPYWVYYFEPRLGKIDIRVLDAVDGKRVGAKTKASVLEAFRSAAGQSAQAP